MNTTIYPTTVAMERIGVVLRQHGLDGVADELSEARAAVAELIEAASDPDVSFRRMNGVQYADPGKGDRARARLRAALARVQVAQS